MPGVPGYPWPGADRSAEVHQPCLQSVLAVSAAVLQTVHCSGWFSQPSDTASYHLHHSCRHKVKEQENSDNYPTRLSDSVKNI